MKIYDIRIAVSQGEGKTFWKTIGTLFCSDNSHVEGKNKKPASFVIDYPNASGIIVRRKSEEEKKAAKERYENDKANTNSAGNFDNNQPDDSNPLPDEF
ncbi:MAG: hypothetical protein AB7S72_20170 [Draconibacterium sp.]